VLALVALALAVFTTDRAATAQQGETIVRYVRFLDGDTPRFGRLQDDGNIAVLAGDPAAGGEPTGQSVAADGVRMLSPVAPRKVLAVGLNYRSHAGESGAGQPELFLKLPTAVIGPDAPIPYPPDATNLHYEGEMVVVIGRRLSNATREQAAAAVFGVTAGNDVSERAWQRGDLQWWRAKSADGFGPVGPVVVTGLDYADLALQTRLNGEVVQKESTAMLIHDVPAIIAFASKYVTLEPGDVIFTGTPGRTRAMKPGDVVEVELEGVGVLRNPIR
jgi:2-keto-4-pentenoate hydratase/2-oxohepta-3-ene-1,7-dioic acid hydratase in catechol pathway